MTDAPPKALIEQIADPPIGRITSRNGVVHIDPKGRTEHKNPGLVQEVANILEYTINADPEAALQSLADKMLGYSCMKVSWDE